MTFKTTELPLPQNGPRLVNYRPQRPRGDQKRKLLVTLEIQALLDGTAKSGLFPDVEAERIVGIYDAGHLLRYSRKKTKNKPDIEQIEGHPEIWALCFRRPKPGWRLLGRFFAKDVFVALRAWDKCDLFGKYPEAAQEVIEDWEALFGPKPPNTSDDITDYLGGVLQDADEKI